MVYFKKVVAKNLRTGESITLDSRYGVYVLKGAKGDKIKFIIDLIGVDSDDIIKINGSEPCYEDKLNGRTHIEHECTLNSVPYTFDIIVGRYKEVYRYGRVHHVLEVDDQRTLDIESAPKPEPIVHLDIPDNWEPSCESFPCFISFTGKVYDATGQHKYANCDITATIEDLRTGELSTVQTTADDDGRFRITFKVRKPGKKKIKVVARTQDGDAEAERVINVTAQLKITLKADKTEIYEGETVNFEADISYGSPNTTVEVCIYVEGSKADCGKVTLDEDGNGKFKFSIEFPSYGDYNVKACIDKTCSDTVVITVKKKGKPKLEVTINVDKKEVEQGDKITVHYLVTNKGDGSFEGGTIYFYVDGEEVTQHFPVPSLPPKKHIGGQVYLVIDEVGTHEIKACVVNGMKVCSDPITVTVKKKKEGAKAKIESFDVSPREVYIGDEITVTAKVKNIGDDYGVFEIYVVSNGEKIEDSSVAKVLDPDEEYTYEAKLKYDEVGEYKIQVCVEVT